MSLLIRLFALVALVALSAAHVAAQIPSPTATPEPAASPSAASAPAPAEAPAPALDPATSPAPSASPTPAGDVIPLEGAPLDTRPMGPKTDEALPDSALVDPNAIIPDESTPPAMPRAVENVQEKARAATIKYREVRVEVEKDPQVVELRELADSATSDEAKRAALREYYRLLFKKIVKVDKSLEAKCREMEGAYLRRLAQDRLEPTIPLNPPPVPAPIN